MKKSEIFEKLEKISQNAAEKTCQAKTKKELIDIIDDVIHDIDYLVKYQ